MSGYMAVAGAVLGIAGGIAGKKAAKKAARQEAMYDRVAEGEQLRQMRYRELIEQSSVKAQYGASGADVNVGSPLNVMRQQAAEFRRQRSAVAKSGSLRRANIKLRGKQTGDRMVWDSVTSAIGGMGGFG